MRLLTCILRAVMNKLFNFNFLLILLTQFIYCDSQYLCKAPIVFSDFNVETSLQERAEEGFLAGTLIKTVDGYIPIEQLVEGDVLASVYVDQGVDFPCANQIVYVKQSNVTQYVQLQIGSEIVSVASRQQFYLLDGALKSACDLKVGDVLSDGNCVLVKQTVNDSCVSYSLCTKQHSFFIYPNIYVHNFDVATISASGALVLGVIEVLNPITLLVGAMVPLAVYVLQLFQSQVLSTYEFDEQDDDLSDSRIALKSLEVLRQTRNYYDTKRKALINIYQDLIKIKNDLAVFIQPNYLNALNFSNGFLQQFQPVVLNFTTLPDISHEAALSLADKEKLIKIRDVELEKLQQEILDVHLILAFHVSEIIEKRDQAKQELNSVVDRVNQSVNCWNQNLYDIPYEIAFHEYEIHFVWREMLDRFEMTINEVKWILAYYEKLKNHFFVSKTTTLLNVFVDQVKINNEKLAYIKSNRDILLSNMLNHENWLRERGFLSQQLINQYQAAAQKYRAEKDNSCNSVMHAKKKKDAVKAVLDKKIKDEKDKNSGGGPEKGPDDDDPLPVKNRNIMMHIFRNKEGHMLDTLENRELLRSLVRDAKNYLGTDVRSNVWYGKILQNGKQLWAGARNNIIRDGGLNETPRVFNARTGLCNEFGIRK